MLDREPHVREPERPRPLGRHRRDLVFENVGFDYQPGNPIIRDINLQIRFGETIAIVGPNGCGKTTLASLIPRFADPTEGVIRIDGIPLAEVSLRELRDQIGLVGQETVLFDDTVFNNIRYGARHATRQQVIEAAQRAHAHRFIEEQLPDGYDTVVGQHGGRLSGGQRQRIALARAILRDPAIIILDEATSQVDLESEQLIQNVLEQFIQNRTAVMITHRLAVLTLADRIVVMDGGRILDVGTDEELRARCGLYNRLYQLQSERPATRLRLDRPPLPGPGRSARCNVSIPAANPTTAAGGISAGQGRLIEWQNPMAAGRCFCSILPLPPFLPDQTSLRLRVYPRTASRHVERPQNLEAAAGFGFGARLVLKSNLLELPGCMQESRVVGPSRTPRSCTRWPPGERATFPSTPPGTCASIPNKDPQRASI